MRYEWWVATRFLRQGKMQTLLIFAGSAVGIGVLVFLTALIDGLQASIIERTLGSQAHVVIRPEEQETRRLYRPTENELVLSTVEQPAQRVRSIDQWQTIYNRAATHAQLVAIAPIVRGAGFVFRGRASFPVEILGIDAEAYQAIVDVPARMVHGEYAVAPTDVLLGTELAQDLGVALGERVRVVSSENIALVLFVRGIYDLGNRQLNARWIMLSLRNGQSLLALPGGITGIEVRIRKIFEANDVADSLAAQSNLPVDSWMRTNVDLLNALEGQSRSSGLINIFVIITVALGIASVLVISVVQRSRQIGILRATGTQAKSILIIFLMQGGLVGAFGALLGSAVGTGLALFFEQAGKRADGTPLVSVQLDAQLYVFASAVALAAGLVSAVLPARRAARLDPVKAIRDE